MAAVPGGVVDEGGDAGEEERARAADGEDLGVADEDLAEVGELAAQGLGVAGEGGGEVGEREAGELVEDEGGALREGGGVDGEEAGEQVGGGRSGPSPPRAGHRP